MKVAATFLSSAKGRLLPASIPFRFFAAATLFHVLMWVVVLAHPDDVVRFRGGPGPALAALHLLTLGVLTATAVGASLQLLPVATRQPIAAVWPLKLASWLLIPGIAALVATMYFGHVDGMLAAAVATAAGLLIYGVMLADNLRRAASLPIVAAYGWAALAALLLLLGFGVLLALDYTLGWLPDHGAAAATHMILAGFGFMGMLVLGFSHVLVPMFALAGAPPERPALAGFMLACVAIAAGALAAWLQAGALLLVALVIGLAASVVHLRLMHGVLAEGMRKRLGLSFILIRAAWWILPLCLLSGLASALGLGDDRGAALFGLLLFGGWLLTFLLGVLQRILPFLASMHAGASGAFAPHAAASAAVGALEIHAVCHGLALLALAAALVGDAAWLARVGGAIGLLGAIAFAWSAARAMRPVFARK